MTTQPTYTHSVRLNKDWEEKLVICKQEGHTLAELTKRGIEETLKEIKK